MNEERQKYRDKTHDALKFCEGWISDNINSLVDEFANPALGCKSWSMTFSYDPERYPAVIVDTDSKMMSVVEDSEKAYSY